MLRHAYLILTHNNFEILEKQLCFLDSPNADFFIHVDAKVQGVDFERFLHLTKWSKVTFVRRYRISWGHFAMVEAELELLKAAVQGNYDYYHLLSGVDVPVKTREYIEQYFEKANGTNFINFLHPEISRHDLWRVKYWYPFQKYNIRRPRLRKTLRNLSIGVNKLLLVDRTRKYPSGIAFQKGTQWFSITAAMVREVLANEENIHQWFRDTYCPDELFVQTVAVNSELKATLRSTAFSGSHANCCRYLDWKRGNPYTFLEADFDELIHTGPNHLFARKFDYKNHPQVVDRLFDYFGETRS